MYTSRDNIRIGEMDINQEDHQRNPSDSDGDGARDVGHFYQGQSSKSRNTSRNRGR